MAQCAWSVLDPLTYMTGCTLDLWLHYLSYSTGSLLTFSQRETKKGNIKFLFSY